MIDTVTNTTFKYGITEKKKAELDLLTDQVLDAQHDVEQLQAIVTSLTEKNVKFEGFLANADANQVKALSNRNLLDTLVQNALDLKSNSEIAWNETVLAETSIIEIADEINDVINKLIYSAEVINKLGNLIVKEKSKNPLISDELVAMITTAGTDANNAVALTLVALKASFAAKETIVESEAVVTLEYQQSVSLYKMMTYPNLVDINSEDEYKNYKGKDQKTLNTILCLRSLIYDAYTNAKDTYDSMHKASIETTKQLNQATSDLSKAEVNLKSLQSGLAAANAAALAS